MTYTYDEALEASTKYFHNDDLAAKVFVDKYAMRDAIGAITEDTPHKMHERIARELARIERSKFDEPLSYDEVFATLDGFNRIIPQGGLMYGIDNPQFISLSNCFVIESPQDSYGSIMRADEHLVQISKRRGGTGSDLSHLRPAGTPTHNSSKTSTGPIAFAKRFSNSIREVGQSGRRGAILLSMSVHHPDIIAFAESKQDLTQIVGANISIRITDEFMNAVVNDEEYEQRWPVIDKAKISKMVSAKKVWKIIVKCAWNTAEPGVLFWDKILSESPADCYGEFGFETIGTNPCCFAKSDSIRVSTKYEIKDIQDVVYGDYIWVGDLKKMCFTKGYIDGGIADVYDVEFDHGQSICITHNHRLLKKNKDELCTLVELKNLHPGDIIHHSHSTCFKDPKIKSIIKRDKPEEVGCLVVPDVNRFSVNAIISGNSELPLCENGACLLLLLNSFGYVVNPFTNDAYFDFDFFYRDTQIAQRYLDNIVDLELECIDKILNKINIDDGEEIDKVVERTLWENIRIKCEQGRRTGLGQTGLGDCLAALNIKYGSKEAIVFTEKFYRYLKFGSYRSSIDMAKELGPFPIWNWALEKNNPFLLRFKDESIEVDGETIEGYDLYHDISEFGRRNIANLTTAPAGSVSLLTRTTSSAEPAYFLSSKRRKKVNENDEGSRVDEVDENGDKWMVFDVVHPQLKTWMDVTGETDIEKSPWWGCCAEDVDPYDRIMMQAAAGRHICHSISSTLNLPSNTTQKTISEIYMEAWKTGLKGITVYRAGCREGIIVDAKPTERDRILPCDVHHTICDGEHHFVLVGLKDGKPYEVFSGHNGFLPAKIKTGKIIRQRKDYYKATFDETDFELSPIGIATTESQDIITRLASLSLRNGVDMHMIVRQLEKAGEKRGMNSFTRSIARVLKKYIPDGTKEHGESCPECGASPLIRQSGCMSCGCGWSKCL